MSEPQTWKCGHAAFVNAWRSSDSLEEVHAKTGLQPRSASRRASRLRRKGIDLDHMHQRKGRETLKTGDIVRLDRKTGRVVMSEHATGMCVIAWTDGTTSKATRRGAIYVEKIG